MSAAEKVILLGTGGFGIDWWLGIQELSLEVVALVDPDQAALHAAAERFHVPAERCFGRDDGAWCKIAADFIIDSSPAQYHPHHAIQAMEHGLDVLVVKPLALNYTDAVYIVRIAQLLNRKLFVAHQKRFLPGFLLIREIISKNNLGQLGIVNIELNVDGTSWAPGLDWRKRMPYPLLLDGSIHHFDLMRWVLGREAIAVFAESFNPPWSPFAGDACLSALLEMSEGLHVNYRASWAPGGSKPVTFFSGWQLKFEHGYVELREGEVFVNDRPASESPFAANPSLAELNIEILRRFQQYMMGKEDLGLSGEANLASLAIVEACLRSIQSGQKIAIASLRALLDGERP